MAGKNKALSENITETKQAAVAVTKENMAGTAKSLGKVMYVGPTVPGIGIQNRVYTKIPADAKDVIRTDPQVGNLFIPIRDYPTANRMIREKKGYIHEAFVRAEGILAGNAKRAADDDAAQAEERG